MRAVLLLLIAVVLAAVEAAPERPRHGDPRAKLPSQLWGLTGAKATGGQPNALLVRRAGVAGRPDALHLSCIARVDDATLAAIAATGAEVIRTSPRWDYIAITATAAQAEAIARLPEIRGVRLPPLLRRHAGQPGTYTNQADSVLRTDLVRSAFNVSGSGITIGVLSNTVNRTSSVGAGTITGTVSPWTLSGTTPQLGGDLPSTLLVTDFGFSSGTDEGEAMLEGIHHLAPGARLAFAAAYDNPYTSDDTMMADRINRLASLAGCQVICDDIAFIDEPMFQDGPIAQAAAAFATGGGIYLAAAGNDADRGISGSYAAVNAGTADPHSHVYPDSGTAFHNFGGTFPGFLPLTIPAGIDVTIVLQWRQPYQNYGLGPGSQVDLDLYLYGDHAIGTPLAHSYDAQGGTGSPFGDPLEVLQWSNASASAKTVYLAVDRVDGDATGLLFRIVVSTNGPAISCGVPGILGYASTYGHPLASGIVSVGAVAAASPTSMESFSSKGGGWGGVPGLPIYYDTAGNLLASPDPRQAPILTAPDGVSVSAAAQANMGTRFYGTSSATPHAAAAAALVWQVRPELNAAQVIARLGATATDITTVPAAAGDDAWSGHGLIDARTAAGNAITGITTSASSGAYGSGSFTINVGFSMAVTGTPSLRLNTTPSEDASYVSGSGTNTLTFSYTVQPGDNANPLEAVAWIGSLSGVDSTALPAAGGERSLSASKRIVIDTAPPTLALSAGAAYPGQACTITCAFSEAVSGFTTSGMSLTNGTIGTLSGSGATWRLAVTPTALGPMVLTVPVGTVVDAAGNPLAAGAVLSFTATDPPPPASGGGSGCGLGGLGGMLFGGVFLLLRRRR